MVETCSAALNSTSLRKTKCAGLISSAAATKESHEMRQITVTIVIHLVLLQSLGKQLQKRFSVLFHFDDVGALNQIRHQSIGIEWILTGRLSDEIDDARNRYSESRVCQIEEELRSLCDVYGQFYDFVH